MLKKIISLMFASVLIFNFGSIAKAESAEYQSNTNERVIVGDYTEDNKQEVINNILAENPDALIFESIEEYNAFFSQLDCPQFTDESIGMARTIRTTKHIQIDIGVTNAVNLYYDYLVQKGGAVITVYQDTVYSSFTGLSPGVTYEEQLLNVRKASTYRIETDWAFTMHYYLLVDGFIEVGAEDIRYSIDHNTTSNTIEMTRVY